jgi:hypothetical protein
MNVYAAKNENARRMPDTFYATLCCGVFELLLIGFDDPINPYTAQGYRNYDS